MKVYSVSLILIIYCTFSLATFTFWTKKELNTVTGDEPHYLVMTSGIVKHASLEQTRPYKEEFESREIYKYGLAPREAEPSHEDPHVVAGHHGLFNVHNIGLPLLLALPFMLGGVVGAKLFMIFCSAIIVFFVWKITEVFSENIKHRWWATHATCVSLPLIPASNQIYPEVLAGLISIIGLYWFYTTQNKRTDLTELSLVSAIVFLPWLHIKFSVTCVLLVLAVSTKIYFQQKNHTRVLRIMMVACISFVMLAVYNYYAFEKISGPYQSGVLELSKTSFMVLLGLFLDQNQGFLLQNPIYFIGIMNVGLLYRYNRSFCLLWGMVLLSLIAPNSMHPNWYGGGSFSGRFGWSSVSVLYIPVIYGLLNLASTKEKLFRIAISFSCLLQIYLFCRYALAGVNLYNKVESTWFDTYSTFYVPFHSWLPMLYNSTWAYGYAPNYAWFGFTCSIFLLGFFQIQRHRSLTKYMFLASGIIILAAGFFNNHQTGTSKNPYFYESRAVMT